MVYLDEERAGKRRGGEEERGWERGMRGLEERRRGDPHFLTSSTVTDST